MNKYGDEQHHNEQTHGDRHLDAQASNLVIHSKKIWGCGDQQDRYVCVYSILFTMNFLPFQMQMHMRLFRAQRNFYISGFALMLTL